MPRAGSGGDVIFGGMPPLTASDARTLFTDPPFREEIGPTASVTVTETSESTVTVASTEQVSSTPRNPRRNW